MHAFHAWFGINFILNYYDGVCVYHLCDLHVLHLSIMSLPIYHLPWLLIRIAICLKVEYNPYWKLLTLLGLRRTIVRLTQRLRLQELPHSTRRFYIYHINHHLYLFESINKLFFILISVSFLFWWNHLKKEKKTLAFPMHNTSCTRSTRSTDTTSLCLTVACWKTRYARAHANCATRVRILSRTRSRTLPRTQTLFDNTWKHNQQRK